MILSEIDLAASRFHNLNAIEALNYFFNSEEKN